MNPEKRIVWVLGVALVAVGTVYAQTPNGVAPTNAPEQIGGTLTIDIITLRGTSPGVPLRFGNVIPGSERVDYDGKLLTRGKDYQMDYETGVVYLMRAIKAGQGLRVSYRYDDKKKNDPQSQTPAGLLPTYKFDLLGGGGMSAILGMGLAERQADGNVLTSNLYGWQTNSGGFSGLMMFGERAKVDSQSGFEYQDKPGEAVTGKSKFILQSFKRNLAGGSINLDYQDISSNFTAFGAAAGNGLADRIGQLQKEKGLKRLGFSMDKVNIGNSLVSNSFRQVRDGSASIDWRSFSFGSGAFKMDYSSRRIDADFNRFGDLAEEDRNQLAQERGLTRQAFNTSIGGPKLMVNFNTSEVEEANGAGLYKKNIDLKSGMLNLSAGEQVIDKDFTRIANLYEAEKGQWGREVGIKRQWLSLNSAIFGKDSLTFNTMSLTGEKGRFNNTDLSVKKNGWSLDHTSKGSTNDFNRLGALSDAEINNSLKQIANAYGPKVAANGDDRNRFLAGNGLYRQFTQISGSPFKDWNLNIDSKRISSDSGAIEGQKFNLTGKNASLNYSKQSIDEGFNSFGKLMSMEAGTFGIIAGFERSDFGLNLRPSSGSAVAFNMMSASTPGGKADRKTFAYTDKKIEANLNTREVESGFQANGMVDPEKDLLAALAGFKEWDAKLKLSLSPKLKFESNILDAESESGEKRALSELMLLFKPDNTSSIQINRYRRDETDPTQMLFSHSIDRLQLFKDFGRFGKISFVNESVEFSGKNAATPDSEKQYLAYETKVGKDTAFRTEQTRTRFGNGETENISANTISKDFNGKAGVSVTDVRIDRAGEDKDETRRNYDFWYDFGKGLKLSYGYVRQINGPTGTLNSNLTLTPGSIDFLKINSASYAENRWDSQRTQGLSNISFASSKPLDLGLFRQFQFYYSQDTASDNMLWVKENKLGGASLNLASTTLSFDYKSQMHASGMRGIDRSFSIKTDQNEKNPLRANISFTDRSLPNNRNYTMRNIGVAFKPNQQFELSHQLITNPEDPQPLADLPMFKANNPWRVSKWNLAFNPSKAETLTGTWEERVNDVSREKSRLLGVTLDLFKTNGSPMQLFFGVEERWGNVDRMVANRYWIRYNQKPGENQLFSIFAGNTLYRHSIPGGFKKDNWTANLNYQLRF